MDYKQCCKEPLTPCRMPSKMACRILWSSGGAALICRFECCLMQRRRPCMLNDWLRVRQYVCMNGHATKLEVLYLKHGSIEVQSAFIWNQVVL